MLHLGVAKLVFVVSVTLGLSLPFASSFLLETIATTRIHGCKLSGIGSLRIWLAPQQLGTFEAIVRANDEPTPNVTLENWLAAGPVDFQEAWDVQRARLEAHGNGDINDADTIIMLQHSPIYTLGTASDESFIMAKNSAIPTTRMDRGGEVTYHGLGQLVVYPIINLKRYKMDLHWYMRALEQAVLQTLHHSFGIEDAVRDEETTGVWVRNHKVAAIGVKCRRWITQHGVAINVDAESLTGFSGIVPCGLEGRKVACVNDFLKEDITVEDFALAMQPHLEDVFSMKLTD